MRISSGLSGAPQENMYDGITVLGTISEGRFFRVLKARIIDLGLSLSDDSVYKGCMGGSQGYSVTESFHNALKDRLRTEMSTFYDYIVGLLHVAQLSSQSRTKKGYGSFPSGIYLCTKQSNL